MKYLIDTVNNYSPFINSMFIDSMKKSELAAFIKNEVASTLKQVLNEEKEKIKSIIPVGENEFITIKEASEKFRVTKATIHNWVKKGFIKKTRISGRTLFNTKDVENIRSSQI